MRKPFAAGNWKMNTDSRTGVNLARSLAEGASDSAGHDVTVAVCPPFVYLDLINKALHNSLSYFCCTYGRSNSTIW